MAEALQEKLAANVSGVGPGEPDWMQGFGKLRRLRKETSRIQARIDQAFEVIESEDRAGFWTPTHYSRSWTAMPESAPFCSGSSAPPFPSSFIVLGEFRYGIAESRHRAAYEAWLVSQLPHFDILAATDETTIAYATLQVALKRSGRPMPASPS